LIGIENGRVGKIAKDATNPIMSNTVPPPLPHISAWQKLPAKVRKIYVPAAGVLLSAIVLIGFLVSGNSKPIETAKPRQTDPDSPIIITEEAPPEPEKINETLIRTKWNLALNYSKNGFYDKSIEELNEILKLDPENEEAIRHLETVQRLKQEAATKKKPKKRRAK
jgi:tetratricopeptide (TPR) repeat protein